MKRNGRILMTSNLTHKWVLWQNLSTCLTMFLIDSQIKDHFYLVCYCVSTSSTSHVNGCEIKFQQLYVIMSKTKSNNSLALSVGTRATFLCGWFFLREMKMLENLAFVGLGFPFSSDWIKFSKPDLKIPHLTRRVFMSKQITQVRKKFPRNGRTIK